MDLDSHLTNTKPSAWRGQAGGLRDPEPCQSDNGSQTLSLQLTGDWPSAKAFEGCFVAVMQRAGQVVQVAGEALDGHRLLSRSRAPTLRPFWGRSHRQPRDTVSYAAARPTASRPLASAGAGDEKKWQVGATGEISDVSFGFPRSAF